MSAVGFQMPSFARIEAQLSAAIHGLSSRAATLTPLERIKLESLLLNMKELKKARRRMARSSKNGPDVSAEDGCKVFRLFD